MKTTRPAKIVNSYNIREIICNPIYTGMGEFPRAISDKLWIKASKVTMETDSKYRFLMSLSASLERSFGVQLIGKDGWIKKIEFLLQKHEIKKVLADLLAFLRSFFEKEVVNKDIGKFYKKWLITSPIPVVIRQIINNLRILLYIKIFKSSSFRYVDALTWLFKSYKSGLPNPPILEINSFFLHVKSG